MSDEGPLGWTAAQVAAWLKDAVQADAKTVSSFDKIDGSTFMFMNDKAMGELGIDAVLRAKIMGNREALRRQFATKAGFVSRQELKQALDAIVDQFSKVVQASAANLAAATAQPDSKAAAAAPAATAAASAAAAAASAAVKPWVFPVMDRISAERTLRAQGEAGDGAYLVRTKDPGKTYVLSMITKGEFVHHLLNKNPDTNNFDVNGKVVMPPVDNVGKLIQMLKGEAAKYIDGPLLTLIRPQF